METEELGKADPPRNAHSFDFAVVDGRLVRVDGRQQTEREMLPRYSCYSLAARLIQIDAERMELIMQQSSLELITHRQEVGEVD